MSKTKDDIFLEPSLGRAGTFVFDQRVVSVFDDMVSRSVPGYSTIQLLLADLVLRFCKSEDRVLDLGCSTGETILAIYNRAKNLGAPFPQCIGYDSSEQMIAKAKEKLKLLPNICIELKDISIPDVILQVQPKVVVASLILQFIDPSSRGAIVKSIFDALPKQGVFLLIEKTIESNKDFNHIFIDYYHSFKKEMGYTDLEIANKRDALENVLIPFTNQQNVSMLKMAGFEQVTTFFQWFNFSGYIAVK